MADLALISAHELSFVEDNSMNEHQLKFILKKTPAKFVHKRPAKGGGEWEYVTGGYVKKCLNLMFGWDWDFEIVDEQVIDGEAIVKGRLTCRSNGRTIVKMQYGNKDIIYKKQTDDDKRNGVPRIPLSRGNDLKAAATDALKKCAAEIGIAADIYNKMDFKEVLVNTNKVTLEDVKALFEEKILKLTDDQVKDIDRVIKDKEENSYSKIHRQLSAL